MHECIHDACNACNERCTNFEKLECMHLADHTNMIGGALHCMYFMHLKMHAKCMHYALHGNFGNIMHLHFVHLMHFVKIFCKIMFILSQYKLIILKF